jgi:TonB family protein
MKLLIKFFPLVLLAPISSPAFAQTTPESTDDRIYVHVQEPPHFPGGDQAMLKFLSDSLRYPELAKREGIEGLVVLYFVVNKDGTRTKYANLKPQHEVLNAEAMRLAKSMPNWVAGKQNGENVNVQYTLPIRFSLRSPQVQVPGPTVTREKPTVYTAVEGMPEFPGGQEAMKSFIGKNLKYPKKARKSKIQGDVYVQFTVLENGQLTNFSVIKPLESTLDAEALRMVQLMPAWQPGTQNGQPVKVKYTLPVRFSL